MTNRVTLLPLLLTTGLAIAACTDSPGEADANDAMVAPHSASLDSALIAQLAGVWEWVESSGGYAMSKVTPQGVWAWSVQTQAYTERQITAEVGNRYWIEFTPRGEYREYDSQGAIASGNLDLSLGVAFGDHRPVVILTPDTSIFFTRYVPDTENAIGMLTPDTLVLFSPHSDAWYHKFVKVDTTAWGIHDRRPSP